MDRIDKFLNRRKQKTKKTIKFDNKYYEITKEDIKIVRQYKKNACLDPTVDMYIPYKLEFTKSVVDKPLEFIKESTSMYKNEKEYKKFVKKNDYIKYVPANNNIIRDIWDDKLEDYEQNILLDITDQFTGKLSDLRMEKNDLEKEIRKAYLRQYLPREKKVFKISDIIKNNNVDKKSLKPYPEFIAKIYEVDEFCKISQNCDFICKYKNTRLEIYETKNFYKLIDQEMTGKILSVKFIHNDVFLLCKEIEDGNTKIYKINLLDYMPGTLCTPSLFSDINNIKDFDIDKYNICITNKSVIMIGTNKKLNIPKIDKLVSIRTLDDLVFITTTNSIKIYNVSKQVLVVDSKIFSYILDFIVHNNIIFLINNLRNIIIFDYERNIVIHSMVQDNDVLSITFNEIYSLLAVSTSKEILIFYINMSSNQYILVNKIEGRHVSVQFDIKMPWLYAKKNNKMVLYT